MGLTIGISGAGTFGSRFMHLFKAHPLVDEVRLAEVFPDRREEQAKRFRIEKTYESLEALCASDVDAVCIFSQRWMHGPQAVAALKAGKHVWSAVPAAISLEELGELVRTVEETGLIYMTAETSYYYPAALYCRTRFSEGDFGRFVYGEGEYYHDMEHFYRPYQHSGGDQWRRDASFPPMYYPTHSTSILLSVTGARMTSVSCLGMVDDHEDGIFDAELSRWGNVFSNETALFRTSDGGMARINEFRRIGCRGRVALNLYGTKASFEEQTGAQAWVTLNNPPVDISGELTCKDVWLEQWEKEGERDGMTEMLARDFHSGLAKVHPAHRLPKEFRNQHNGHQGSHQFLVDDFVKAVSQNRLPPNHVWAAARYCAPGIVAHESANQDGVLMDIPEFGSPPQHSRILDPEGSA